MMSRCQAGASSRVVKQGHRYVVSSMGTKQAVARQPKGEGVKEALRQGQKA